MFYSLQFLPVSIGRFFGPRCSSDWTGYGSSHGKRKTGGWIPCLPRNRKIYLRCGRVMPSRSSWMCTGISDDDRRNLSHQLAAGHCSYIFGLCRSVLRRLFLRCAASTAITQLFTSMPRCFRSSSQDGVKTRSGCARLQNQELSPGILTRSRLSTDVGKPIALALEFSYAAGFYI